MKHNIYNKLKTFLFNANAKGYAGSGKEVKPQRPGFNELEYKEGDWLFHDSYSGHYFAPGQEIVYFKNKPIWAMAYSGGMQFIYHGNKKLTRDTFIFLKKALLAMDPKNPYRGPNMFTDGGWKYTSTLSGTIKDFHGTEKIYFKNKLIFSQNFIGGTII